jgi:hypothetical protein
MEAQPEQRTINRIRGPWSKWEAQAAIVWNDGGLFRRHAPIPSTLAEATHSEPPQQRSYQAAS